MHEEYWNSKGYSGNWHVRWNTFIDYLTLLLWDQNEDLVYIGLPTHFCFFCKKVSYVPNRPFACIVKESLVETFRRGRLWEARLDGFTEKKYLANRLGTKVSCIKLKELCESKTTNSPPSLNSVRANSTSIFNSLVAYFFLSFPFLRAWLHEPSWLALHANKTH